MRPSPVVAGIAIYAVDTERLVAFYRTLLGLVEVDRGPTFVTLAGSEEVGGELSIVAIPEHIAAGIAIASPPVVQEDAAIKPVLLVDSLDAVVADVTRLGGGTQDPATAWSFRGLRRLDGFDPEGNVVQFAERIG